MPFNPQLLEQAKGSGGFSPEKLDLFKKSGFDPSKLEQAKKPASFQPTPQVPLTKEQRQEGVAAGMQAVGKALQFPLRVAGAGTAAVRQLHKEPLETPGAGQKAWGEFKRAYREESTPSRELLGKEYSEEHPFQSLAIDLPADILATGGVLGASKGILGAIPKVEKATSSLVKEGLKGLKRANTFTNLNIPIAEKIVKKQTGKVVSKAERLAIKKQIQIEKEELKSYSKVALRRLIDPKIVNLKRAGQLKDISSPQSYFEDAFESSFDIDKTGIFPQKTRNFIQAQNNYQQEEEAILDGLRKRYPEFIDKDGSNLSRSFFRIAEKRATPDDKLIMSNPKVKAFLSEIKGLHRMLYHRGNQALKIVGKKMGFIENYAHHFRVQPTLIDEIFKGVENVPDRYLTSEFFDPKNPYAAQIFQRKGGPFEEDLIGGFKRYLSSSLRLIHLTKPGQELKVNARFLPPTAREAVEASVNYAFGQAVKGDELLKDPMIKALNNVNNRVISNLLGDNLGITIAQSGSLIPLVAETSYLDVATAMRDLYAVSKYDRLRNVASKHSAAFRSRMVKDSDIMKQYFRGQVIDAATKKIDEQMTLLSWRAGYLKAIREGMKKEAALLYADRVANATNRILVRSQLPAVLRSRFTQFLIPAQRFQLGLSTYIFKQLKNLPPQEKAKFIAKFVTAGYGVNALSFGLGATIQGMAQKAGIDERKINFYRRIFSWNNLIPFYGAIQYGVAPTAGYMLRAARGIGDLASSFSEDVPSKQREKKERGLKSLRDVALITLPRSGGATVRNVLEGRPFGGEKPTKEELRRQREVTEQIFGE